VEGVWRRWREGQAGSQGRFCALPVLHSSPVLLSTAVHCWGLGRGHHLVVGVSCANASMTESAHYVCALPYIYRWSLNQRGGTVRTIRMEPVLSGAIGFYRAELEVPQEAWGSDLVFVDTQDVSALVHMSVALAFLATGANMQQIGCTLLVGRHSCYSLHGPLAIAWLLKLHLLH
jgi:hypothetical protein